jgi:hypothetical protein
LQPTSYADYQSGRLALLTPDQRLVEKARLDGLTPAERAQEEANWRPLSGDSDRLQSGNPDRPQPISYATYESVRMDRLTPGQRLSEQTRIDGLTPEERAQEEIKWNHLTPEEQLHRTSGHLGYRWLGPGYVLQSQVLSNHPNNEEIWARSGYTPEEISANRTAIADKNSAAIDRSVEERAAFDQTTSEKAADLNTPEALRGRQDREVFRNPSPEAARLQPDANVRGAGAPEGIDSRVERARQQAAAPRTLSS